MREKEILDQLESITQNFYNHEEKAVIFAHILDERSNIRTASGLERTVFEKIAEHGRGGMREAQNTAPKISENPIETSLYPKPFEIINKNEIDAFLEKMTSSKFKGDYFGDTFDSEHPTQVMNPEGVGRHRSDFNVSNIA
jgi:hypothetical protein